MIECHICGAPKDTPLYFPARLVSSDIQEAAGTAQFFRCSECETLQKVVTPQWRDQAARIYADYWDDETESAALRHRFERILELLADLPETGRLLDIGCGPGHFLKRFSIFRPAWQLAAAEFSDRWQAKVCAIPAVVTFDLADDTPDYGVSYDVIVLSHVLEHLPNPADSLYRAARKLASGGRIVIAVPNYRRNAADLVIADHCTHFDIESLARVVSQAGLQIDRLIDGKELIVRTSAEDISRPFMLLAETRRAARALEPDGIMGSSIAACWLQSELGTAKFFVDEDKSRIGQTLSGLPILAPEQVPPGSVVFIPLAAPVAEGIIARWRHLPIDFRYVAGNRV